MIWCSTRFRAPAGNGAACPGAEGGGAGRGRDGGIAGTGAGHGWVGAAEGGAAVHGCAVVAEGGADGHGCAAAAEGAASGGELKLTSGVGARAEEPGFLRAPPRAPPFPFVAMVAV